MKKTNIIISVFLAVIAAVLCITVLITIIIHSNLNASLSSTNSNTFSELEFVVNEESTPQNISETYTSTKPQSKTSSISSITSSKPGNQSSSLSLPSTTSNSGRLSWGENKVFHPTSGLPFKDRANPETGLSWDGVSPIIYTYPDGTTGTVPKDNATYEYIPGWIETYKVPRDVIGRELGTICNECGKSVGLTSYGKSCSKNTRNLYCECCGVYVTAYTCHTCSFVTDKVTYCSDCGKSNGNGINGTCVQWLMGDVDCPHCGVHVSVRTCHTCGE